MDPIMSWSARFEWWNRRRPIYNIGLALAGFVSFGLYVAAFELWAPHDGESELTLFTTAFQAAGYLLFMGMANALFFAGPISEAVLQPRNVSQFRFWTFLAGLMGSMALPFAVPLLFYLEYGRH